MCKYTQCDICEKPISYKGKYSSVNLNNEYAEQVGSHIEINVIHSENILELCRQCGAKVNKDVLKRAIKLANLERASILSELILLTEVN